jgi:hypothetical protein
MQKSPNGFSKPMNNLYISPDKKNFEKSNDLIAELKIKNEKIRLFYQSQMASI